jgi:hypothetical protein
MSPPSSLVQVSHTSSQAEAIQETITTAQKLRFKLATNSEALFCDQSLLNLPALVWAGFVFIGFLAYIMGVHSITYSPIEGLNKQVGFFWAPNWTLLEMIILPLFLITVAGTLNHWKRERHSMTAFFSSSLLDVDDGWARKVEAFSLSHWALIFICFFVVFILQWYGVYMRALMDANSSDLMMDWNLIAIVRPEVISVPEATLLSMLAFLYTASICFLFLTGLVLLFTLAADFYDIHASHKKYENKDQQFKVQSVGLKILCGIFRCTILGILIGTCIKLQGTFLLSDGETIVTWLVGDALYAIGSTEEKGGWLAQRSLAHFTSFLLVFSTCSVFIYGFVQIFRVLNLASLTDTARTWGDYQIVLWSMMSVVFLLVTNFLLIGQIPGFSIFLAVSILSATYSLYDPMFGQAHET